MFTTWNGSRILLIQTAWTFIRSFVLGRQGASAQHQSRRQQKTHSIALNLLSNNNCQVQRSGCAIKGGKEDVQYGCFYYVQFMVKENASLTQPSSTFCCLIGLHCTRNIVSGICFMESQPWSKLGYKKWNRSASGTRFVFFVILGIGSYVLLFWPKLQLCNCVTFAFFTGKHRE